MLLLCCQAAALPPTPPASRRLLPHPRTGHVLRRLGLPAALSVLPASAGVLLVAIAGWPSPLMVAAAEVCRKLLAYSLARPARESLFTVLSREEKCELGGRGAVSRRTGGAGMRLPKGSAGLQAGGSKPAS